MKSYKKRLADKQIEEALASKGAVIIEGLKWCGKTTTAKQHAKSILYLQDPTTRKQNLELATIMPKLLLEGETPRLIDEWQLAPNLWDTVRFVVDERGEYGQFILTGSNSIEKDDDSHSGIGRIVHLKMRTMSLFESMDSSGDISLGELFNGNCDIKAKSNVTVEQMAYLICRGGWPSSIEDAPKIALKHAYDYLDGVIDSEIITIDGKNRDRQIAQRLIKSYARNIGSMIPLKTLLEDSSQNENTRLHENTIYDYIKAFKRIFLLEDLPAWNVNLRSKTAIRTTDKRYFTDPSIAAAALNVGPSGLFKDMKTFGFLFENLCIRDLNIYVETIGGKLYHYRDKTNLEADAVIQLRDGNYALIEIKLGNQERIDESAKNLIKLRDKIDTDTMNLPAFMMIITATEYAYKREDGIYIVPIACLKN